MNIAFGLALAVSSAQPTDVDWKMYGTASVDGGVVCFYDRNGVTHRPNGYVRVWTKCLLQKDLDGVDPKSELGDRIAKNAAHKISGGYVPPIMVVESIGFNQITVIVPYEETADIGDIQLHDRFFYELNCSERMMRRLSTYAQVNGTDISDDNPGNWEYVPPEGSGATLLKILCP